MPGEYYDPEAYARNYMDPVSKRPVGIPVSRNNQVHQIEVQINTLRARKRPEINDAVVIGYIRKGIYNVIDIRDMQYETSNGYLWFEVEPDVWIAFSESWSVNHESQLHNQPETDERNQLIIELQAQNAELIRQSSSQAAALRAIKGIISEIVA